MCSNRPTYINTLYLVQQWYPTPTIVLVRSLSWYVLLFFLYPIHITLIPMYYPTVDGHMTVLIYNTVLQSPSMSTPSDILCTGGCRNKLYSTPPIQWWIYCDKHILGSTPGNRQSYTTPGYNYTPGVILTRKFKSRWLVLSPSVCSLFSVYFANNINEYLPAAFFDYCGLLHLSY